MTGFIFLDAWLTVATESPLRCTSWALIDLRHWPLCRRIIAHYPCLLPAAVSLLTACAHAPLAFQYTGF